MLWAIARMLMARKPKRPDYDPSKHVPVDMTGTSISCSCGTTLRIHDPVTLELSLRYRSDKLLDLWLLHEEHG